MLKNFLSLQLAFDKNRILNGLFLNGNKVLPSRFLSSLATSTVSDGHKLCNIQESDVYMSLVKDNKENLVMDKVVKHIMKENILVPEVALNNSHVLKSKTFMTVRRKTNKVPPEFKVGRYSPRDQRLILEYFEELLKDAQIRDKEALKREILEKPDEDILILS